MTFDFRVGGCRAALFHCEDAAELRLHLGNSAHEAWLARNMTTVSITMSGKAEKEPRGGRFVELKLLAPLPLRELNFSRRVLLDMERREPSGYGNHQGEDVFLVRQDFEPPQGEDELGTYGVSAADARWIWQLAEEALERAQARNRGRS